MPALGYTHKAILAIAKRLTALLVLLCGVALGQTSHTCSADSNCTTTGNNTHSGTETFKLLNGIAICDSPQFAGTVTQVLNACIAASTSGLAVIPASIGAGDPTYPLATGKAFLDLRGGHVRWIGGDGTAGGLGYNTRWTAADGSDLVDVLSDNDRKGGFRRSPNSTGTGDRFYAYTNFEAERRAWFDESIALTANPATLPTTTLAANINVGDSTITLASVPSGWTKDIELEIEDIGSASRETFSIEAVNGNVLTISFPAKSTHSAGTVIQRYRGRGSIFCVTTSSATPNTDCYLGYPAMKATEGAVAHARILQAQHVRFPSLSASFMATGMAFGGQSSAGSGMAVHVNGGILVVGAIGGTGSPTEGVQYTSQDVTLAASDLTNPRIDTVYIDQWGIAAAATGTPAGSPAAPALPANTFPIAAVTVPANAVSSASFTITDTRNLAAGMQCRDTVQGCKFYDPNGNYIKLRIDSGAGTYAIGCFNSSNVAQSCNVETGVTTPSLNLAGTTVTAVPQIVKVFPVATQTAAIANTAVPSFTPTVGATYRITNTVRTTVVGTAGTISANCGIVGNTITGSAASAISLLGFGSCSQVVIAESGDSFSYGYTFTSVTGSPSYVGSVTIERLQ